VPGPTIAAGRRFPDDDGSADPGAAAALAAFAAGEGSEHAALTALAPTRLLVPVVAVLTEAGESAGGARPASERREKASEMALPTLVGRDGRHAVLAFTSLASLARWRPGARPVPVPAAEVWQAGLHEASAVVVDVAGPVPLTVEGARLAALAAGEPVPRPHEDSDLRAAAAAAAAGEQVITEAGLAPGRDAEVLLRVTLAAGHGPSDPAAQAAVQRAAAAFLAAAGGRLRRGLEVAVTGTAPR
jgi:SseB protein N-terminal domain